MKTIQTLADIEALKVFSTLPLPYLAVIEQQFQEWYESENEGESITAFRLPSNSYLVHLEDESDAEVILHHLMNVEFVEYEAVGDVKYYRIGLMTDHQMNVIYFLEGTLDSKVEEWLRR